MIYYTTRFAYCQRISRILWYYLFMNAFGERLREQRIEQHLKQRDVASALGISVTCYAGYEQGYREPDFATLIKICRYFSVSADFLLGLE